jgi:hypothetical protein
MHTVIIVLVGALTTSLTMKILLNMMHLCANPHVLVNYP